MLSGRLCERVVQADIREGLILGRGAAYSLYGLSYQSRVQLSMNEKVPLYLSRFPLSFW